MRLQSLDHSVLPSSTQFPHSDQMNPFPYSFLNSMSAAIAHASMNPVHSSAPPLHHDSILSGESTWHSVGPNDPIQREDPCILDQLGVTRYVTNSGPYGSHDLPSSSSLMPSSYPLRPVPTADVLDLPGYSQATEPSSRFSAPIDSVRSAFRRVAPSGDRAQDSCTNAPACNSSDTEFPLNASSSIPATPSILTSPGGHGMIPHSSYLNPASSICSTPSVHSEVSHRGTAKRDLEIRHLRALFGELRKDTDREHRNKDKHIQRKDKEFETMERFWTPFQKKEHERKKRDYLNGYSSRLRKIERKKKSVKFRLLELLYPEEAWRLKQINLTTYGPTKEEKIAFYRQAMLRKKLRDKSMPIKLNPSAVSTQSLASANGLIAPTAGGFSINQVTHKCHFLNELSLLLRELDRFIFVILYLLSIHFLAQFSYPDRR